MAADEEAVEEGEDILRSSQVGDVNGLGLAPRHRLLLDPRLQVSPPFPTSQGKRRLGRPPSLILDAREGEEEGPYAEVAEVSLEGGEADEEGRSLADQSDLAFEPARGAGVSSVGSVALYLYRVVDSFGGPSREDGQI